MTFDTVFSNSQKFNYRTCTRISQHTYASLGAQDAAHLKSNYIKIINFLVRSCCTVPQATQLGQCNFTKPYLHFYQNLVYCV